MINRRKLKFSLKDPLNEGDTETQTYGCRASNPEICKNCYIEGICAFSSEDCICKRPSIKWKDYYVRLKEGNLE